MPWPLCTGQLLHNHPDSIASEDPADAWRSIRRTRAGYARWTVTAGKGGNDTVA
jgi:hypothetical protein